jgi:hypothetical protein
VGSFVVIRPSDDAPARQASDWCDDLIALLTPAHHKAADVSDRTPAGASQVQTAAATACDVVFYFGHGSFDRWVTSGTTTLDASSASALSGKPVVSIACKTARDLGPDAITAGATAWLGFTIKVPVIKPHRTKDPLGEAIVNALSCLANGDAMQQARDAVAANLDGLVSDYDTGGVYAHHPEAGIAYYAVMCLRDHVIVHGTPGHVPLP